jgi:hypothetical protein
MARVARSAAHSWRPGIAKERTAILCKALDETMTADLEVAPIGGDALQRLVEEIYRTPKDIVDKTRAIVK